MPKVTNSHSRLRRRGWTLGLITAAGAVLAVAATSSIPSIAAQRPTGASAAARAASVRESGGTVAVSNQNALSDFRAWMFQQPGFGTSGYVGTMDDLASKGMTVMWYGKSTPLLTSMMTEGANRGITMSVKPSSYSLDQLTTASRAVFTEAAAGEWAGFKVEAVEALSAGDDGLTIDGAYTSVPAAERAPQVRSLVTTVDGVPATLAPGHLAGAALGRDDDFTPHNAGGLMADNTSANGDDIRGICTSGFSITFQGNHYNTTARHCIYETNPVDNFGDYVARVYHQKSTPSQYMYGNGQNIYTGDGGATILTGSGSPVAFVGSYTTSTADKVEKLSNVGLNDLVCIEGGNSGGHCNVKVTNMLVMFDDQGDGMFETIRGDEQTSGAIAVIQGDSGGPVIVNLPDGNVGAAGMIQAYDGNTATGSPCAPAYDLGTNICGTAVLFSSMTTIIKSLGYGYSLYTSS